jgi:pSer/pThr/pTyr-binding forkhead associated (FHA) protein
VTDLFSSNGTFVNGEGIPDYVDGVSRPGHVLQIGDILSIPFVENFSVQLRLKSDTNDRNCRVARTNRGSLKGATTKRGSISGVRRRSTFALAHGDASGLAALVAENHKQAGKYMCPPCKATLFHPFSPSFFDL